MEVFFLTIAASAAALLGGLTALRSSRWINWALALTAGLVLGLVFFDLMPEIFETAQRISLDTAWPMVALVTGFLLFHVFEKFLPIHAAGEEQYGPHSHPALGTARAAALSGHSFLDGLSIGVAFQVSTSVGAAVSLAVIGHRFADGFDTTTFMVFNKNKLAHIKGWLAVVVLMPILGGLLSLVYDFPQTALAIYLGFFAGFILYIAASNILPQAHSQDFSRKSILLTVFGAVFMLIVTRFT
jgi:ZIP family zinc transporter